MSPLSSASKTYTEKNSTYILGKTFTQGISTGGDGHTINAKGL